MFADDRPQLDTEALMTILDLPLNAVNVNRAGMFSEGQKDTLMQELELESNSMTTVVTIMLAAAVVVALIMSSRGVDMMPLIIGAAIIILPFLWFANRRQQRLRTELQKPRIRTATGLLELSSGDVNLRRVEFRVDAQVFPLRIQQMRQIESFAPAYVRAFFVQNTNQLLSIEVIDAPPGFYDAQKRKREEQEANQVAVPEKTKREESLIEDIAPPQPGDHPLRKTRDEQADQGR